MIYDNINKRDMLHCFTIKDRAKLIERYWQPLSLFVIIVASGTASCPLFFDTYVLPKQISSYFLAGTFTVISTLPFNNKKDLHIYPLDKAIFAFLVLLFITFCLHDDISSIVNVIFFVVMYITCRRFSNETTLNKVVFTGVSLCACYSIIMAFWQTFNGNDINGGYDTTSGLSLITALSFVFLINHFKDCKDSTHHILLLVVIATAFFVFFSLRTGLIAVLYSSVLGLKNKARFLMAIAGGIIMIFFSIHKSESTCGRLFVYKTSLSLLDSPKNIIIGRGSIGFRSAYMSRQAEMLREESYTQRNRADNIKHPLNDFLLFIINWGLPIFILGCALFAQYVLKAPLDYLSCSLLITIIIFAAFTYPFHYPITYIILAFTLAKEAKHRDFEYVPCKKFHINLCHFLNASLGITTAIAAINIAVWNRNWKKAYTNGMYGLQETSLTGYQKLSESLWASDEFHYNWAYMLMKAHRLDDASIVINKCRIVDYDTQILKGDIFARKDECEQAIQFYKNASEMCPNRFLPLYAQFNLYERLGMHKEKRELGNEILQKEEKVPSVTTKRIKNEVACKMHASIINQ